MTHSFLRYAESMPMGNQKVQVLIDDLRKGLSEEDLLQQQEQDEKLRQRIGLNIKICYCIMFHVACQRDIHQDDMQYVNFINNWQLQQIS